MVDKKPRSSKFLKFWIHGRDLSTPLKEASPTIIPLTLVGIEPHQKLLSITCQEEQLIPALALEPKLTRTKTSLRLPKLYWKEAGENHDLRWKRLVTCC